MRFLVHAVIAVVLVALGPRADGQQCGDWTNLGSGPPARSGPGFSFNSITGRTVLFGGFGGSNLADTWEWDGAQWNNLTGPGPSARRFPAMTFDSAWNRTVLFGGFDGSQRNDTWIWQGSSWNIIFPAASPSARNESAMVYDSARDRIVLFGGWTGGIEKGDTWEYDRAGNTWVLVSSTGPSARSNHAMAYDSDRERTILFGGGRSGGSQLQDTWEWDGATWTQTATVGPSPRRGSSMAYDSDCGFVVLVGGRTDSSLLSDTWIYGGLGWTPLSGTTPVPRVHHRTAYDAFRKEIVAYGGADLADLVYDETWVFADSPNVIRVAQDGGGDFATIQAALNAAEDQDIILVCPGTYVENVDFLAKSVRLRSLEGPEVTIIDGDQNGPCVQVLGDGDKDRPTIEGFTLRNGTGRESEGAFFGGGVYCNRASISILGNVIRDNTVAGSGGGVYVRNTARATRVVIRGNLVEGNVADAGPAQGFGGGIGCLDITELTIQDNILRDNRAGRGGGGLSVKRYQVAILNNLVVDNEAGVEGGGVYIDEGNGRFESNTVAGNEAPQGAGIDFNDPSAQYSFLNSISQGNTGDQITGSPPSVNYCNIGGLGGGTNIDTDPLFVAPSRGDYYLQQDPVQAGITNPCVDTGDPSSPLIEGATRSDRIVDSGVLDMGYHDVEFFPLPEDDVFLGDQEDRSGYSGDPVNTATGNFAHQELDLSMNSRGDVFQFARFYNSQDPTIGSLGRGWNHTFGVSLQSLAGEVVIRWGDGRADSWLEDSEGVFRPGVPNLYGSLAFDTNEWVLRTKSLHVYRFDSQGRLTSITDRSDNTTSLDYSNGTFPDVVTTITEPAGRTLTLTYDGQGKLVTVSDFTARQVVFGYSGDLLISVQDVMGGSRSYGYDDSDRMTTIQDQRGVVIVTNVYDGEDRVISQADGRGSQTTFSYDNPATGATTITQAVTVGGVLQDLQTIHRHSGEFNLLDSIEFPSGELVAFSYDSRGNRSEVTDRNGNTTSFVFDDRGNVITTSEPDDPSDPNDGGTTVVEYGEGVSVDLPTRRVDALGFVTEWEYDSSGNLTREIRYLDVGETAFVEKSWTYNPFGQRTAEVDERFKLHEWTYDAEGRLTSETTATGDRVWYAYDALWRETGRTDGRGVGAGDPLHTTTFSYDAAGRLTQVESPPVGVVPHPLVEVFTYDGVGNIVDRTDGRGNLRSFEYDGAGNLTRVVEPLNGNGSGRVTIYEYDEANRQTRVIDPNGHQSTKRYDDDGRLLWEEDQLGERVTFTYDPHGNVTSMVDRSGVLVEYEYDSLHRRTLVRETHGGGDWVSSYDQRGQLTSLADPRGHTTAYVYDALGRLTRVDDAEGGSSHYDYDAAGNLTSVVDASGKAIQQTTYRDNNQVASQVDGKGGEILYEYDAAGNRIRVEDPNGWVTTIQFDAVDRPTRVAYDDGTSVEFEYDDNGNTTRLVDPLGTTTFAYDEQDRLISSVDPFGQAIGYGYDSVGNRTSLVYPDGKTVSYDYDSSDRLTRVLDWATRETTLTYQGTRLSSRHLPSGIEESRSYDSAGRLEGLETKNSATSILFCQSWVRDGVGNPISQTDTGLLAPSLESLTAHYRYDEDDRLVDARELGRGIRSTSGLRSPLSSFQYDENGNLNRLVRGGVRRTFSYDRENRLRTQTVGPRTIQHGYDGLGRRLTTTRNGTEVRFVLDYSSEPASVLCETDGSGMIQAYYVRDSSLLARYGSDGSERYYHADDLGSTLALTDENENVTDRYAYTPFGVTGGREGTSDNPFTFLGGLGVMQEADGLLFMRARFHDPESGRFLSKDPIEGTLQRPGTLHRYVYALNNPEVFVDADGEKPKRTGRRGQTARGVRGPLLPDITQGRPKADKKVKSTKKAKAKTKRKREKRKKKARTSKQSTFQVSAPSLDLDVAPPVTAIDQTVQARPDRVLKKPKSKTPKSGFRNLPFQIQVKQEPPSTITLRPIDVTRGSKK